MKIEYKKTLKNAPDLTMPIFEGDVGFDLSIVELLKRETKEFQASNEIGNYCDSGIYFFKETFDTGIAIKPPDGYYFKVIPRSSITKTNYRLSNSTGIIDEHYRGSIKVVLDNFGTPTEDDSTLPLRLVQLILEKNMAREVTAIEEVQDFESTKRGSRGFGSTG